MKIIIAQGNPGTEYENTRHNVGFLAVDHYAHKQKCEFQVKSKFHAQIAEYTNDGEKILLVKPMTFYNETGVAARAIIDFYKVSLSEVLVIHDELALPFGTLRTRDKGRDAGNNGIKSLNAHLGEDYARIRVGIRNDLTERIGAHDFVLSRFKADELDKLNVDVLPKIADVIDDFVGGNHQVTSHTL